jgi:eukaryotic-like serine/threonine-protein kinase
MGEVYRARDTRLDRIVAIKVSDERFSDRFEREARAIAQLNHPHICQVHDVGPNYLVMEYLEGTPLTGPLPVERAVALACEILDAIAAAHRRGITHRDLKPANILVTTQGTKLLDFGLAKSTGGALSDAAGETVGAVTAAGQIVGTLQYMAPEQLQGKSVDVRSDLFSFGCVMYEMLTGQRAFDGADPASVIAAVLTREAPSLAGVAPALDRVVRRALAKDPEQRFQTASDLKAAMVWAMEHPPAAEQSHPRRRKSAVLAATLAMAVAGVAAGWSLARLRQPASDDRMIRFEIPAPQNGRFVFGTNTGGVALSPDGSTLAFVASVNGRNGVWTRRMDDTTARLLPGTEGAGNAFWSPDSRSVAFVTGSSMKRVGLDGGLPILICGVNGLRGAAWFPTGDIVFGTTSAALQKVPASGGTPAPFTALDNTRAEGFHGFPQVLPSGKFLYFVRASTPENTGIWVASIQTPSDRVFLTTAEANALVSSGRNGVPHLLWTRGGTLLAQPFDESLLRLTGEPRPIADGVGSAGVQGAINATASSNGVLVFTRSTVVSQFTWFDRSGNVTGRLGEPADYTTFDLSPDGGRVVVSRDRPGGSDMWLLDAARGGVATRLTSRTASSTYGVWSPDATQILFSGDALLNIFRKQMQGTGEEQRLTTGGGQLPMDWSPDGKTLLFYEIVPVTGRNLLTLPASTKGDEEPVPYLRTPFNEWWGRFAPTIPTKWIAYQSDESGDWEVYVDTFPTPGGRRRISTGGGQFPMWGPKARELFYVTADQTLMSVDVTLGENAVESGTPKPLFRLSTIDTGRRPFAVTADGQRFLVRAIPPQAAEPLIAIVNWPLLLENAR